MKWLHFNNELNNKNNICIFHVNQCPSSTYKDKLDLKKIKFDYFLPEFQLEVGS